MYLSLLSLGLHDGGTTSILHSLGRLHFGKKSDQRGEGLSGGYIRLANGEESGTCVFHLMMSWSIWASGCWESVEMEECGVWA